MACRDKGTSDRTTSGFWGSSTWNNGVQFDSSYNGAGDVAWYTDNSGGAIHEVGTKGASSIGTYDMHGNALEFCLDWFKANNSSYTSDPVGPTKAQADHNGDTYWRIGRSGNFGGQARIMRTANRFQIPTTTSIAALGCRVFLVP